MSQWGRVVQQTKKALWQRLGRMPETLVNSQVLFSYEHDFVPEEWVCTSDQTIGGKSVARLSKLDNCARFSGVLSTFVPVNAKKSGFAYFRSRRLTPTLFGESYMSFEDCNAIELVVRGDGRTYTLNIQTDTFQPEDLFQAFVYTRGGPYWQTIQIPMVDFLLTTGGYVQEVQQTMNPDKLTTIGLSLADRIDGPFALDIKTIRTVTMARPLASMDAHRKP